MSEAGRFTIELEHQRDYLINVHFDWPGVADVVMDEPPPLGEQAGPNASRLLAAAAGNCLTASLLFCLTKTMETIPEHAVRTTVTCRIIRNEQKRMRVGGLEAELTISGQLEQSGKLKRCLELFEDFCVVSASIRQGIPLRVTVRSHTGEVLHQSE